jgi:hypothetical protein
MSTGDQILRAHATIASLRTNLPNDYEVDEAWVRQFNEALGKIESALNITLDEFKIAASVLYQSIGSSNAVTGDINYRQGLWVQTRDVDAQDRLCPRLLHPLTERSGPSDWLPAFLARVSRTMEALQELRLHIDALASAVEANPKFFASVRHYVAQFQQLVSRSKAPTLAEFEVLTSQIDEFWAKWRPSGGDGFYIPPRETADTDGTVNRVVALVRELDQLSPAEFLEKVTQIRDIKRSDVDNPHVVREPCVFIGHGRSRLWARVKTHLEDELGLATVTYESEPRTGDSIVLVLEKMLDQATFALLLLTAEDEGTAGGKRARQNVVHEAGLFQGRLGFKRAVLLMQEGIEEFSNVAGLQHIPFSGQNVEQTFYELRRVLKRERQIEQ